MTDTLALEDKLPILARELAMGIYEVEDILKRYGVDWDEWERLSALPRFQSLLAQTTVEWGSTLNTRERIKVKALAGVEDGLPGLFQSAKDARETLASRVEAYKLARVLAGIGEKDPNEAGQEKFTLTINVGSEKTVIGGSPASGPTIEGGVVPPTEGYGDTGRLFEFTSEVRNDGRREGLNEELTAGYDERRHGGEEK